MAGSRSTISAPLPAPARTGSSPGRQSLAAAIIPRPLPRCAPKSLARNERRKLTGTCADPGLGKIASWPVQSLGPDGIVSSRLHFRAFDQLSFVILFHYCCVYRLGNDLLQP